jgi:capsular polysaccharide export protein
MRRILTLAGLAPWPLSGLARPRPGDAIGLWHPDPVLPGIAARAVAQGLPLLRIAEPPLRLALPGRIGRQGAGPAGLMIDRTGGMQGKPRAASALETLLATHPLDDTALLDRAREGMARLADGSLCAETAPAPPPGHVLILDQPRGDAAQAADGAGFGTLREMLFRALDDHPGARVVICPDPDTPGKPGHFGPDDARDRVTLLPGPVNPQALLDGAVAVYTVSAPSGFRAILAGHRPRVFGRPFYAGWGLTDDHGGPMPHRHRPLTRAQLFAAAMILAPVWHDPCRDRLCRFEDALDQMEAAARAFRQDQAGHVATGMRLWKRGPLQGFFGRERPVIFADPPARAAATAQGSGRSLLVWAGQAGALPPGTPALRVEDGLIRSRGLGADLVPPLSLVADDLGIYYDPTRPSGLERLVATPLRPGQRVRAERLVARLVATGVTKYNLGGALPDLPPGHRILVPGQVEDDASIRLGAGDIRTNLALLERVRAENPRAVILWKPHPDVEAGLRPGAVPADRIAALADATLSGVDAAAALAVADAVWTITSTLGFEALLRGVPVTCLGAPFYAGWGLTRDLGPVPARRQARPDIATLAHAALIGYPRYRDPISGHPCPPEVVVDRIADGRVLPRPAALRLLAAAQGALAGQAWLWRR